MPETLANLRGRAQRLSDTENDSHIANTDWLDWANDGYRELWDLLSMAHGDRFIASATFTLTASSNVYALPATFRRMRSVMRVTGNGLDDFYELPRINWQERRQQTRLGYRVMGRNLSFWPAGASAGNYKIEYAATPTALAADGDQIDQGCEDWSEFIVVFMAINARTKSEQDVSLLLQRKAEIRERLTHLGADVDDGMPDTIIDAWGDQRLDYLPEP